MSIIEMKTVDIHLYREDGRDVWCNQGEDGFFYDKKGNQFINLQPKLYQDMTGNYLYSA